MKLNIWTLTILTIAFLTSSFSTIPTLSLNDEKAPEFVVETLEGKEIALSDLKGKVVYVSFWASWCGPCISGFNKYEKLRREVQDLGVVMLNVSIDKTEDLWQNGLQRIPQVGIQAFAKKDKIELMHNYELASIPSYYIIDKKGNFAYLSNDPNRNIVKEFEALVAKP